MNRKSLMLISKSEDRYKEIDAHKTITGSFYTTKAVWLTHPVDRFIRQALAEGYSAILDPFAGDGHLLETCFQAYGCRTMGYDLEGNSWPINDSLLNIPNASTAVFVTNPPYLAKHSAKRKGVVGDIEKYFAIGRDDLYQVALDRCLSSSRFTVAIIPETFLNSRYDKSHLVLTCVLEENPFQDTENPVCVACFDTHVADGEEFSSLYVGERYCGTYGDVFRHRKHLLKCDGVKFNVASGNVALKAVDGTKHNDQIRFENADHFAYGRDQIKVSSRLLTYIAVSEVSPAQIDDFVELCNSILLELRQTTHDLILSPFKGNNKAGKRRRRLDYALARAILCQATREMGISCQRELV